MRILQSNAAQRRAAEAALAQESLDQLLDMYQSSAAATDSRLARRTTEGEEEAGEEAAPVTPEPPARDAEVDSDTVERRAAAEGCPEFFTHTVTAADTLGGLELRYGVSASMIRRLNGMTSDRLHSHLVLKIPKTAEKAPTHLAPTVVVDKKTERLQIIRLFRTHYNDITEKEIDCYLQAANGAVGEALRSCIREMEWEAKHSALLPQRSASERQVAPARRGISSFFSWRSSSSSSSSSAATPETRAAQLTESTKQAQLKELQMSLMASPASSHGSPPSAERLLLDDSTDGLTASLLSRDYLQDK